MGRLTPTVVALAAVMAVAVVQWSTMTDTPVTHAQPVADAGVPAPATDSVSQIQQHFEQGRAGDGASLVFQLIADPSVSEGDKRRAIDVYAVFVSDKQEVARALREYVNQTTTPVLPSRAVRELMPADDPLSFLSEDASGVFRRYANLQRRRAGRAPVRELRAAKDRFRTGEGGADWSVSRRATQFADSIAAEAPLSEYFVALFQGSYARAFKFAHRRATEANGEVGYRRWSRAAADVLLVADRSPVRKRAYLRWLDGKIAESPVPVWTQTRGELANRPLIAEDDEPVTLPDFDLLVSVPSPVTARPTGMKVQLASSAGKQTAPVIAGFATLPATPPVVGFSAEARVAVATLPGAVTGLLSPPPHVSAVGFSLEPGVTTFVGESFLVSGAWPTDVARWLSQLTFHGSRQDVTVSESARLASSAMHARFVPWGRVVTEHETAVVPVLAPATLSASAGQPGLQVALAWVRESLRGSIPLLFTAGAESAKTTGVAVDGTSQDVSISSLRFVEEFVSLGFTPVAVPLGAFEVIARAERVPLHLLAEMPATIATVAVREANGTVRYVPVAVHMVATEPRALPATVRFPAPVAGVIDSVLAMFSPAASATAQAPGFAFPTVSSKPGTVAKIQLDSRAFSEGARMDYYLRIGQSAIVLADLRAKGVVPDVSPRELPAFFSGVGAYLRQPEHLQASTATVKEIMLGRLSFLRDADVDERGDAALAYLAASAPDERYVVTIIGESLLPLSASSFKVLTDKRVIAVVVGHYLGADHHVREYPALAERVNGMTALIRQVTGAPVLLAVSAVNLVSGASDALLTPKWAQAFGDTLSTYDGFAVYNLHNFAAFELQSREEIRDRLGLPDMPMIVLDFVGTGWRADQKHAEVVWRNKGRRFFDRLAAAGWRGVTLWAYGTGDFEVKSEAVSALPPDLQLR